MEPDYISSWVSTILNPHSKDLNLYITKMIAKICIF